MAAKKGTEYVCGLCGTTLLVTEEGDGYLETVICCDAPMKTKSARAKGKAKPKKAAKRKKK